MSASTARNGSASNENDRPAGTLIITDSEHWWRYRYNIIAKQGYRLHPRYHPQWEQSWSKTGKDFYSKEHGQPNIDWSISTAAIEANRIQDGRPVMLKKVLPNERPQELRINLLFSSPEFSGHRDNHCAPLLGVIELSANFGSQKLMVFLLFPPFNRPRVQTFGEFATLFTQICEGIRFLHERNVAHRDCTTNNIKVTATRGSPRYYFIDFGLSRQYPSRDAMDEPLPGGDESAPEHRSRRVCNPFHTDIYYIGNLVRKEFMECDGFEFLKDLVASMTQDTASRPRIEVVLQEFSRIRASMSRRKQRSAILPKNTPKILQIFRQARQFVRNLRYIVSRRPLAAIPD